MANNVLINNSDQYSGLYVAKKSFLDKNVLVSGSDPSKVYDEAKDKGIDEPVVFYVPERNIVQIY